MAAIYVASIFIDGVDYQDDFLTLLVAGLVFGLVNWLLKPVVTVLSLPLIILSLGVALFFVNLLMLYATSWIVGDFEIRTFGAGVAATVVIWVVNSVLYLVLRPFRSS